MPVKVIKMSAHLPVIPEWLKINNSITFTLPLQSAKELAKRLIEVEDDVDIELNLVTGKQASLELKWDSKKEETQVSV